MKIPITIQNQAGVLMTKKERKSKHAKAYREKNKERIAEYMRAWREANGEQKAEIDKAWGKANPDKVRAYKKKYRDANKERNARYSKEWRKANPDYNAEYTRAYRATHPEYRKRGARQNRAWREENPEYEKNWLLSLAEKNPNGYVCDESRSGENSGHWKGGISKYPRSTEFRVNRLIVLNEAGGICDVCRSREATQVHHIDFSKDNHSKGILMPVCTECHKGVLHSGEISEREPCPSIP